MNHDHKLETLARVAALFNEAGITWAVGASAMLFLEGVTDTFNDIDILVDEADIHRAEAIMDTLGQRQPFIPKPQYRTRHFAEYRVGDVDFDVMAGYAIVSGGVVHDCSIRPDQVSRVAIVCGQSVPLQSLATWRHYYTLMGRTAKVALIDDHFHHPPRQA